LFEDDYQFVAIATDKMEGGDELMKDLIKGRSGGMPWMVVLDGDGQELISSTGPKGNIGCPIAAHEVAYFVEMIKKSSDVSEERLEEINQALTAYGKKLESGG
jgi:hypothetical protein